MKKKFEKYLRQSLRRNKGSDTLKKAFQVRKRTSRATRGEGGGGRHSRRIDQNFSSESARKPSKNFKD